MPAIGSQPERAARNTRKSEVSSGGVDTRTTEAPRTSAVKMPGARVPVNTPSGRPTSVARASALSARIAVLAARSGMRSATGRS